MQTSECSLNLPAFERRRVLAQNCDSVTQFFLCLCQIAPPCGNLSSDPVCHRYVLRRLVAARICEQLSVPGGFFHVTLSKPILVAPRGEALVERGGEDRYWHSLVDSRLDRPPAFA
jgi:hypothetical protein